MRIAGAAACYHLDPLDKRFTGLDMSEGEPWWATAVRGWLMKVKAICEGYGEVSAGFRKALELGLKTKPPSCVYKIYDEWADRMEQEANK